MSSKVGAYLIYKEYIRFFIIYQIDITKASKLIGNQILLTEVKSWRSLSIVGYRLQHYNVKGTSTAKFFIHVNVS